MSENLTNNATRVLRKAVFQHTDGAESALAKQARP